MVKMRMTAAAAAVYLSYCFFAVPQQMCIEDETQNHICHGYTQTYSNSSHKPSRMENRAAAVILTQSNERLKLLVSVWTSCRSIAQTQMHTWPDTNRNQLPQVISVLETSPDGSRFTTSEAVPLVFLVSSHPFDTLLWFLNNNFLYKRESLNNLISRKESMKSCSNHFQSSHSLWQRGLWLQLVE